MAMMTWTEKVSFQFGHLLPILDIAQTKTCLKRCISNIYHWECCEMKCVSQNELSEVPIKIRLTFKRPLLKCQSYLCSQTRIILTQSLSCTGINMTLLCHNITC